MAWRYEYEVMTKTCGCGEYWFRIVRWPIRRDKRASRRGRNIVNQSCNCPRALRWEDSVTERVPEGTGVVWSER